jgi:hypothetical protein
MVGGLGAGPSGGRLRVVPEVSDPSDSPGRRWLSLSDAELLTGCEVDLYRASGPGGQKRNKTSSAVRLRHIGTGLIVTAVESRSQHENRARALRRLRRAIAMSQRNPLTEPAKPPDFYAKAIARDPALHVSDRNPDYLLIVQHLLDVLAARQAVVADTAADLEISTGQFIRFLKQDPDVWAQANQIRKEFGRTPLR